MADSSFWTLLYLPTGEEKTFTEWGISPDASRSVSNSSIDTFQFRIENLNVDNPIPFAAEETCIVKRNGVRCFYGRVTNISLTASAKGESVAYTLSGPWWYLEHVAYEQIWKLPEDPSLAEVVLFNTLRSHVILYATLTPNEFLNVSQQVQAAVQFAIDKGSPFALGDIDPSDAQPPSQEVKDMMCSEVIRTCLKWAPDSVAWFDYSTAPVPTLHIRKRSSLVTKEVPMPGPPTTSLQITPRHDLKASGVKIVFESTTTVNDVSWQQQTVQQAGADDFKTLRLSIPMTGFSETYQTQKAEVTTIDISSRAFWESFYPMLKQATDVSIGNVRLNNVLCFGQTADASDTSASYDKLAVKDFTGTQLPAGTPDPLVNVNLLTAGQVPDWLKDDFADAVVTAKISYTLENPDSHSQTVVTKAPFTAKVKTSGLDETDGLKPFTHITSVVFPEPIPTGLAAAYYAAVSVLHYDGSITLIEDEVSGAVSVGHVLNIMDGPPEWETMSALVQTISESISTGQTQISFGPPSHLTPQDFIELQRVTRQRHPAGSYIQSRIDGRAYGTSQVDGAVQTVQGLSAGNPVSNLKEHKVANHADIFLAETPIGARDNTVHLQTGETTTTFQSRTYKELTS